MNVRSAMLSLGRIFFHVVFFFSYNRNVFLMSLCGVFSVNFSVLFTLRFPPSQAFFSTAYKDYFIFDLFMATAKPSHLWEIHF